MEYITTITDTHTVVQLAPEVRQVIPSKRVSKLTFIKFLGNSYRDILIASKTNVDVEMFVKMLDWATPEADGTSIDLDDERTIQGLQAMETAGLLPVGKTEEIRGYNG